MSTDSTNKKSRPLYKKPALWIIIASVIVVALVGTLIGSAVKNHRELDSAVSQAIKDYNLPEDPETDVFPTESHFIYGKEKNGNQITVYAHASYAGYAIDNSLGIVEQYDGVWYPCAITFEINEDSNYELLEFWIPSEGSYYASSIKDKFPPLYAFLAINFPVLGFETDTTEVYEDFNVPRIISFVSPDNGHLFCDEKGDVVLTLDTATEIATLEVNGKVILTDNCYCIFDFDDNGDTVDEYIYIWNTPDYSDIPDPNDYSDNAPEYDFTIIDENTLCVTNLPEKPVFTRVEE